MENVCYVCGSVGFEELLVTCTRCEGASIHEYCMETTETGVSKKAKWVCEDCEETPKHAACKFSNKVPQKRSTKALSTNESIALASQSSPSKGKRCPTSPEKVSKKVEISKKRVESPPLGGLRVCSTEQNRYKKPPMHAGIPSAVPGPSSKQKNCVEKPVHSRTSSPISKPSPELRSTNYTPSPVSKPSSELRSTNYTPSPVSKPSSELHRTNYTPSSFSKPPPELRSPKERSANAHTTSKKSRVGFTQDAAPCKDTLKTSNNTGEQIISDGQVKTDKHLHEHLASYPAWKGTLTISGHDTPVGLCNNVSGYPSKEVSKKAYDFAREMPSTLHFDPVPRSDVWETMFNGQAPDKWNKCDVGLYFIHNGDRSEQCRYYSLVSYLDKNDLILRSCISGIELLIFSPSHLEEESKKTNQAYYLWGLFKGPATVITSKEPAQNQLPSATNTEPAIQGTVKLEVPSDSHPSCSKTFKAATSASQPVSVIQVKPEKWDRDDLASTPKISASVSWEEPRAPPGFERVKLKAISEIMRAGDR